MSTTPPSELTKAGFSVSQQQATVIDHIGAHKVTVASAGAGSGKTYTTVAAVLHLIAEDRRLKEEGIDIKRPASIDQFVLISFTNKAANELRANIQKAISKQIAEAHMAQERFFWREQQERLAAAYIGTIHGFCRRVLKLFGYLDGIAFESGVTFAKELKDKAFNRAILEHYLGSAAVKVYGGRSEMADYELLKLTNNIHEYALNQNYSFERILASTEAQETDLGKPYRVAMADILVKGANYYSALKAEQQVLDSHDLVKRTAELLAESDKSESIRNQIAIRYQFLFIDEFQDTDVVQKKIVDVFVPHLRAILLVGDKKQSIYGFRGTQVDILEEMAQEYMKKEALPLNISRRPTERFRKVVNSLFGHIAQQPSYSFLRDGLESYDEIPEGLSDPAPLFLIKTDSTPQIQQIADLIKGFVEGNGARGGYQLERKKGKMRPVVPGDFVILTRDNYQLHTYVQGLRAIFSEPGFSERTYEVRGDRGEPFYALPEIVSVLYMLQLLLSYPYDDAALTLAMDTPYLRLTQTSLMQSEKRRQMQRPAAGNPLSDYFRQYHGDLHQKILELKDFVRTATIPQLLEQLYRLFSIRAYYFENAEEQAVQNLEHLREVARHLFTEDQALTLPTFVDYLRKAKLTGREEEHIDPPKENSDPHSENIPPYVRVMTIHRSKGLQFPLVIIPEIHRPLIRVGEQREPAFLLDEEQGLEVKLKLEPDDLGVVPSTVSARFRGELQTGHEPLRQEEMRVFYVAVTRAEHSIILMGENRDHPYSALAKKYSWQCEVQRAHAVLEAHHARFERR